MRSPKKILLVEQDLERIRYLRNFFLLLGDRELEEASDRLEALAKINAFEPELVILDSEIPQLDVKDLIQQTRQKHLETKLLVLAPNPDVEKALKKEGALEVLTAPFDLSDLSRKIKTLLPAHPTSQPEQEYARLLVVDDEPGMHVLFEDLFRPLGIEVCGASDAEEALQVFKEKSANLAIVDLKLPGMDGTKLIEVLEKSVNPPSPKAFWIMTAGLGENQTELNQLRHPVLIKPLDLNVLEERVVGACKKYGLRQSF